MRLFPALTVVLMIALMLVCTPFLYPEIIVKQDRDGNITVSNHYTGNNYYVTNSKRLKYETSGSRPSVPTEYRLLINRLSKKYGVDEQLVFAVARAESSFNPFAVSHKGAVGIMQLMPETAKLYGVSNRYNADQNIDAGIQHLKYLYDKYKDIPLTLAAYNAGEQAVAKYGGVPPYKETRTYVKRVMSYMGKSYQGSMTASNRRSNHRIYRIVSNDGKITITDTLPRQVNGTVTVLD